MIEHLVNELNKRGYHFLSEGTLKITEAQRKKAQRLESRGYKALLTIIATKHNLSYLRTLIRY